MAAAALFAVAPSWVTQMQSKYGVQPADIANAWEGVESAPGAYGTMGWYWHWPADADDNRGLGGSITWAWDDELCKETSTSEDRGDVGVFEDVFNEDFFFAKFVVCKDIRAAMHRAFQTWTDVHHKINFIDVTEECRRLYGHVKSNCSLAEVFVTHRTDVGATENDGKPWCDPNSLGASCGGEAFPNGDPYELADSSYSPNGYTSRRRALDEKKGKGQWGDSPGDLHTHAKRHLQSDEVETTGAAISAGTAAASASQYGRWAYDLRSTNGHVQQIGDAGRQVIETFGGIISFNVEKCWYLDSSFCAPLHELKSNMGSDNALAMCQGLAYGVFALAAVTCIVLISRVAKHQHCGCDNERTKAKKAFDILEEVNSWGVLPLGLLLLMLWTPISLQVNIFTPCWECYDFEAAATHEIGHILGLNHPNAIGTIDGYPVGNNSHNSLLAHKEGIVPYTDLVSNGTYEDACSNPWKYVVAGAWDDGELTEQGVRNSIMEAFTEHNPKVCLTADDLEAINVLYPVCDGRAMTVTTETKWNCAKSKQRIGWVRVLVYIFIPIIFIMAGQMLILSRLEYHEEEKIKQMEDTITATTVGKKKAEKAAAASANKAAVLQETLEVQIATEDDRVEERAQQLAAEKIQAHLRRKKDTDKVGALKNERAARAAAGEPVNYGTNYTTAPSKPKARNSQRAPGGLPPGTSSATSIGKV